MASTQVSYIGTWRSWKGLFHKLFYLHKQQTTLIESIAQESEKNIFSGKSLIKEPGTTIGVRIVHLKKMNAINRTEITIWDFAGQLEYSNNHQVQTYAILTKSISFLPVMWCIY